MILFWVILAVYLVGWAGFSVTIARVMDKDLPSTEVVDRVLTVMLAMIVALFWPLVIPGGWVYKRVFARKDAS